MLEIQFIISITSTNMLCFEPYTGVSSDLMTTLFDSSKSSETVPEEISVTYKIATSLKNAGAHSQHIKQLLEVSELIVYHNLRDQLDRYSLFRGRNLKVSKLKVAVIFRL